MDRRVWNRAESDNLASLVELDERSLLESIEKRYVSGKVYTDVGDILLAVNPFKELPIYSEEWSKVYSVASLDDLSPHIFGVAARAFNALIQTKKNQVCVISGESGAGKTESTKLIIHQLMRMCKSSRLGEQLQRKIIQINPVLEAFGNAKTLLNDNSSRFGKFIQLMFTCNGRIVGGGLDQYLLEKSRVCRQGEGECNYHIFYYLFDGLSPDLAQRLMIKSPESHNYMHSYKNVKGSLNPSESRQKFVDITSSMKDIGFVDNEIDQVLTILAAILHLGDIEFISADGDGDGSSVKNSDKVKIVSQLLKIECPEDLSFSLTTLRTTTRGETVDKLYSPSKAADVRDAMAKALYSRMFHWLVSRINSYLAPQSSGHYIGIGILDIFGFEVFKENSFEQFCINVANEQLQQYFNTQIFSMEKEEYVKEGVTGVDISYQDNQPVLELFLSRPMGLISLLDEQCRTNGNESALLERYRQNFGKHSNYEPHKGNALVFTVHHYAGKVEYNANGFLDKNRDSLPEPVQSVLKFSSVRLVRTLFTKYPDFSGSVLHPTNRVRPSQRSVMKKMSVRRKKSSRRRGGRGGRRVMTVSGHFRESLQKLMERILSATPHFVRCFKPNQAKTPSQFDNEFVLKQLKYTGMLEAVRVRREGFSYRPFFSDFIRDYKQIAFALTDKNVHSSQLTCQTILGKAGITGWKTGRSRVFLRYFHEEKLNSMLLDMENKATRIQAAYRGYLTRKMCRNMIEATRKEKEIVKELLSHVRRSSEANFTRIVELNKLDVLLAIERFGHPNEGNEHPPTTDGRKRSRFKPKAVGGVAVLIDGQIGEGVKQKWSNQERENGRIPHVAPSTNVGVTQVKKTHPSVPVKRNGKEGKEDRHPPAVPVRKSSKAERKVFATVGNKEDKAVHLSERKSSREEDKVLSHSAPDKEDSKSPVRNATKQISTVKSEFLPVHHHHHTSENQPIPKNKHEMDKVLNPVSHPAVMDPQSPDRPTTTKDEFSSLYESRESDNRAPPTFFQLNHKTDLRPAVLPRPYPRKLSAPAKRESGEEKDPQLLVRNAPVVPIKPKRSPKQQRDSNQSPLLSVSAEKRSRSVSPVPRRQHIPDPHQGDPQPPNRHSDGDKANHNSLESDDESEDGDYIEMEANHPLEQTPVVQRSKRPVGEVKLFPSVKKSKSKTVPYTKSQLTPESPVNEYQLKFGNKGDLYAEDHTSSTRGTLVNPISVKSYTIQTDASQLADAEDEYIEIVPQLPEEKRPDDADKEDDEEYIYPFVYQLGERRDTDGIIYANCQRRSDGELHEYINTAFIKDRKRSLGSNLPRTVKYTEVKLTNEMPPSAPQTNLFMIRGDMSSSVPDLLLADTKESRSKPSLFSSDSMDNLLLRKGGGLTLDSPLLHRVSIFSGQSDSPSNSPTSTIEKQKKKKFGNFFKKKKISESISRELNHASTEECSKDQPFTDDKDPIHSAAIPGYFPGISEHNAHRMLSGQSPGAYVVFTDYLSGNFIFKLAVSQGRGKCVWTANIEPEQTSSGESGLSLISTRGRSKVFSKLGSLTTYYKSHPLNKAGLHLTTPLQVRKLPEEDKVVKKKPVPVPTTVKRTNRIL